MFIYSFVVFAGVYMMFFLQIYIHVRWCLFPKGYFYNKNDFQAVNA